MEVKAFNLLIEAAEIAENTEIIDLVKFSLNNPLKLSSELLRQVVIHSHFRAKINKKVHDWANVKTLIAPPKLSVEQCSSSFSANYKKSLMKGSSALDLTGGLGVDSYFLSQNFKDFTFNELNPTLFEIAKFNFKQLNVNNVSFSNLDAETFLKTTNKRFDLVYLDPARRDSENKKLFKIEDCQPNLLELKDRLFGITSTILVKFSPILDLKLAIKKVKNIHTIIILSEKNEIKEILLLLKPIENFDPIIKCINETTQGQKQNFDFRFSEEENCQINYSLPQQYLYEANASLIKAGAFKLLAEKFELQKIAPNSHLYTSDKINYHFPGRIFKIINQVNYDKKKIQTAIPSLKANISCRNFPYNPGEIKKNMGLKEGGENYLFFSENHLNQKIVLICTKINVT